jgi:hypothetical protein
LIDASSPAAILSLDEQQWGCLHVGSRRTEHRSRDAGALEFISSEALCQAGAEVVKPVGRCHDASVFSVGA